MNTGNQNDPVARLNQVRERRSKTQEELIRLKAKKESVDKQLEDLSEKAKSQYGVSTLSELREMATRRNREYAALVEDLEKKLAGAESVVQNVKKELAKLEE